MAVAAVALIVDGGSLVAAYALLPHVVGTALGAARLRLAFLRIAHRQRGVGPRRHRSLALFGRKSDEDRAPLRIVGLGRDLNGHHP